MSDVTRILSRTEQGDPVAAEQLLPLVYEELRKLAAVRLAQETPGQTLQATALVHEAYLRLVGHDQSHSCWDNRGHFFAAAAAAMRRILVDRSREKQNLKRGGQVVQRDVDLDELAAPDDDVNILALDEALHCLAARDQQAARLVDLRYFAGLTSDEAARALGISSRTADRLWAYARSFLLKELGSA